MATRLSLRDLLALCHLCVEESYCGGVKYSFVGQGRDGCLALYAELIFLAGHWVAKVWPGGTGARVDEQTQSLHFRGPAVERAARAHFGLGRSGYRRAVKGQRSWGELQTLPAKLPARRPVIAFDWKQYFKRGLR